VKKGTRSAGVQRQCSGTADRTENCQIVHSPVPPGRRSRPARRSRAEPPPEPDRVDSAVRAWSTTAFSASAGTL